MCTYQKWSEESTNIDICKIDIEHEYMFEANKYIILIKVYQNVFQVFEDLSCYLKLEYLKSRFESFY